MIFMKILGKMIMTNGTQYSNRCFNHHMIEKWFQMDKFFRFESYFAVEALRQSEFGVNIKCLCWIYPPNSKAKWRLINRDFGFPSKNEIILVVTVSGFWVADPASMIFTLCRSECSSNSFPWKYDHVLFRVFGPVFPVFNWTNSIMHRPFGKFLSVQCKHGRILTCQGPLPNYKTLLGRSDEQH